MKESSTAPSSSMKLRFGKKPTPLKSCASKPCASRIKKDAEKEVAVRKEVDYHEREGYNAERRPDTGDVNFFLPLEPLAEALKRNAENGIPCGHADSKEPPPPQLYEPACAGR